MFILTRTISGFFIALIFTPLSYPSSTFSLSPDTFIISSFLVHFLKFST